MKQFNNVFNSVHQQPWPQVDQDQIKEEMVTIIVQVNGKKRGEIKIENEKAKIKDEVERLVLEDEKVKAYLVGKKIQKTIFVPGKLVNLVIK